MPRFLREMISELVRLPLLIKLFVVVLLVADFIVITKWDLLRPRWPHGPEKPQAVVSTHPTKQNPPEIQNRAPDATVPSAILAPPDIQNLTPVTTAPPTTMQEPLAGSVIPLVINAPQIDPDGSIRGNIQTMRLYGIKQLDKNRICVRASGEKWACGLHAYATLRNMTAQKTIVCQPRAGSLLGLSATCRIGNIDIGLQLLRDGLAELEENIDDPAMVNSQAYARDRRLGIWDR